MYIRDVILDEEKGRSPDELVAHVQKEFNKEFNNKDPLMVEEIRDMNLKDLLLKYGASEKEVTTLLFYYIDSEGNASFPAID